QMFRQQHRLLAIQTFDKMRHEQPPYRIQKSYHHLSKVAEFSHTLRTKGPKQIILDLVQWHHAVMKTLLLLVLMSWPVQSLACFGRTSPVVHTFFPEFPAELEGQPYVARVKIVSEGERAGPPDGILSIAGQELRMGNTGNLVIRGRYVPVLVTEGIKGAAKGETLEVFLFGTGTCPRHYNTEVGSERYIAGALHDGLFIGSWRERDILAINGE
ncbi:MAG: hypothetical protein ABJH45_13965, partial [Paracoccaceae bacterium]